MPVPFFLNKHFIAASYLLEEWYEDKLTDKPSPFSWLHFFLLKEYLSPPITFCNLIFWIVMHLLLTQRSQLRISQIYPFLPTKQFYM